MKKVILVQAVALLGLASCKKDYTCEWTVSVGGLPLHFFVYFLSIRKEK